MGISLFGRKCWTSPDIPQAKAPDPAEFEIIDFMEKNGHIVAKINYPACTNFEGNKIVVFLNTTYLDLTNMKRIDPHFSKDIRSPFARFTPTKEGMKAAIKLIEEYKCER